MGVLHRVLHQCGPRGYHGPEAVALRFAPALERGGDRHALFASHHYLLGVALLVSNDHHLDWLRRHHPHAAPGVRDGRRHVSPPLDSVCTRVVRFAAPCLSPYALHCNRDGCLAVV
eukprot:7378382-Prymnesium_polylepis.1